MKSGRKHNKFRETEKRLTANSLPSDNAIFSLNDSDFDLDGRLSSSGYNDLKNKIKYVNIHAQITITVPPQRMEGFTADLEGNISPELLILKKDIKSLKRSAFLLFLIGGLVFGICRFLDESRLFYEVSIVAFWVFEWGAVEKMFFETPSLNRLRIKLLQLAAADVKIINSGK